MDVSDLSPLAERAGARRRAARQRLYETFQGYHLSPYGSSEGACAHCLSVEQFEEVAGTPVAELRQEQTWVYGNAVWSGVSDLKCFLPRLLELVEPMDELVYWDVVERKLPREGWLVCSEKEREVTAGYVAATDECLRLTSAAGSLDLADVLRPLLIPERIARGLPLVQAMWGDFVAQRDQLILDQIERCRAREASALSMVARAVNALFDGKQDGALKQRLLSAIPADDVFLSWLRAEEPTQLMGAALADGLDDDAALCVATALSSLALLPSLE